MTIPASPRVLIVTGNYPPEIGGPAVQTQRLAKALEAAGCAVRVLTEFKEGRGRPEAEFVAMPRGGGPISKIRRMSRAIAGVRRHLRQFDPQFVISQTSYGYLTFVAGVLSARHGALSWIKVANDPVLDLNDKLMREGAAANAPTVRHGMRRYLRSVIARLMFASYDFVWATSPTFAAHMKTTYGLTDDKVLVRPNMIDLPPASEFSSRRREQEMSLAYVGRLQPIKGVDILLEALGRLKRKDWHIDIIGSGDEGYTDLLHAITRKYDIGDRVRWIGSVPAAELPKRYRVFDLVVVPSRSEAFGNVILEAMALGVPVIATRTGGTPFIARDGDCAKLVPVENPDALAKAIDALMDDPDERMRLVEAGKTRARDFAAGPVAEAWMETFAELSAERSSCR